MQKHFVWTLLHALAEFSQTIKTMTGSRAFSISGPALWNALPEPINNAKTILAFRKSPKSHLFDLAFPP